MRSPERRNLRAVAASIWIGAPSLHAVKNGRKDAADMWTKWRKFSLIGVIVALIAAVTAQVVSVREAQAIPAFARKYDFACNVCHVPSFPKLNDFENLFRDHSSISRIPQGPTEETCKPAIFAALCSGESLFSRPMSWFHEKNTPLFIAGGSPPATICLSLIRHYNCSPCEEWGKETSSEADE